MDQRLTSLTKFLAARSRVLATLIAASMLFNGLVVIGRAVRPDATTQATAPEGSLGLPKGAVRLKDGSIRLADGTIVSTSQARKLAGGDTKVIRKDGKKTGVPGVVKKVMGVTDTEIKIVYYWKEERTKASPALSGTAAEGANLDEALAFREYVKFINKHANDGTRFMGIPINLHGRKLVGEVVEVGSGDFSYAQNAEKIAVEKKPFAAIASHGGISAYICPRLAQAGIFNLSTYDVGGKGGTLIERTNGYCVGAGLAWERQIDLTIAYLTKHKTTTYGLTSDKRAYGVIYSEYPGMDYAAPKMIDKLRAAGIPIAEVAKIPADLATSQTQARTIIDKMKKAGVNTLIMPEGNTPLNFTHAAQANGWDPDYYVWPCSGQDSAGMVRLFNAAQWEGAEGLSCYDEHFDSDAANDDVSRKTEWFAQYQEMHGTESEPPAPAPLVYSSMAQLLAGITYAGRALTPLTFNRGLNLTKDFRYDGIKGVTTDRTKVLLRIGTADRSFIGDVGHVRWSATAERPGGVAGKYLFLEDKRYGSASAYRS